MLEVEVFDGASLECRDDFESGGTGWRGRGGSLRQGGVLEGLEEYLFDVVKAAGGEAMLIRASTSGW